MSEPTTTENTEANEAVQEQATLEQTLKALAKDVKEFDSLSDQQQELEEQLSALGRELINVIENGVSEDSDRTEDVIAAERKRVDRKLARLNDKAKPDNHLAEVDAALSALQDYRQNLSS